ncbi:hypothetical protein KI387_034705 [Taxus chinensis]|uniref:Uncharacterized protein n=1 Tax=Taxus chinensis TaxID=29808 RepID=A0AA38F5N4_TAXCH|nr:hypothetical protein KI387_034705 [Taxus chinensis]
MDYPTAKSPFSAHRFIFDPVMEKAGSLTEFHVKICDPVMVPPCIPSPKTILQLSAVDNYPAVRGNILDCLLVYNASNTISADPATVIREALSKVLVYYFPFAGRMRNKGDGELEVDCTGEGALFVEAMADDNLSVLGGFDYHNPAFGKLLYSLPLDTPIHDLHPLVVQVTRFTCGGCVVGLSLDHSICDGHGAGQFLKALAEMARGEAKPSLEPIWNRELLKPEDLIRLQFYHFESMRPPPIVEEIIQASVIVNSETISNIKQYIMEECKESCSAFEVVAALAWLARTRAFQIPHTENVKLLFAVDTRRSFDPPLPKGYYGNAAGNACAMDNVQDLLNGSLLRAIMIIKKSKVSLNENIRATTVMRPSTIDVNMKHESTVGLSDLRHLGFNEVDFGWGYALNASLVQHGVIQHNYFLFLQPSKNMNGGIKIAMFMPQSKVKPFKIEMEALISKYATKV